MNVARIVWPAVIALSISGVATALSQTKELGTVDFPNSGSSEAQPHFIKGVKLLHSFEWDDAARSFKQAQELDPDFALAYWGEALSHTGGHHFPPTQDISSAREALTALGRTAKARSSKAATGRERAYLEAVELLYGSGDLLGRSIAYSEKMAELSRQYPDDREAAAFYALSLMRTAAHGEQSVQQDMLAASIAQDIARNNPDHPGAAHYTIHALDDPHHAPLALHAARKYLEIAPVAVHALHMPSHIFLQLGLWGEMAAANNASYQASVERVDRLGVSATRRDFHALYWSQYAYLQQGLYDKARACLEEIRAIATRAEVPGRIVQQFKSMEALQVVEAEEWRDIGLTVPAARVSSALDRMQIDRLREDADTVDVRAARIVMFATGLSALKKSDLPRAREAQDALTKLYESIADSGELVVHQTAIMSQELDALILLDQGDTDGALRLLEEATVIEEKVRPSGPPGETNTDARPPLKPSHELYGEVLLELNRPSDALLQFEQSLSRMKGRSRSVLGAARAAARSGKEEKATHYYRALVETAGAGPSLPGLEEARAFLEAS